MNREDIIKEEAIERIWIKYEAISHILLIAGVPIARHPIKTQILPLLPELHINKIRIGEKWIDGFMGKQIESWFKIRKENTEDYWQKAELMGWGEEYQEIKALNLENEKIKKAWFHRDNLLSNYRRRKSERKQPK